MSSERAAEVALSGRGDELFSGHVKLTPVPRDTPDELLGAWRVARQTTLDRFRASDDRAKIVWGGGPMSVRSFADSRVMETWAHGLDCFAAVDRPAVDTARLRRIAGLAKRALPYAFIVAGGTPPNDLGDLALDLQAPDGSSWWFGPADTTARISGPAGDWCRVATRRLAPASSALRAEGPLAEASLRVARAYLAD